MGRKVYEKATELLITADAGGSNAYRSRVFKTALQKFADRTGLTIGVSHFPPGTSKWNKIEHRMFCHITENWRGRPLVNHETIVQLIGATRTTTGLRISGADSPLNGHGRRSRIRDCAKGWLKCAKLDHPLGAVRVVSFQRTLHHTRAAR